MLTSRQLRATNNFVFSNDEDRPHVDRADTVSQACTTERGNPILTNSHKDPPVLCGRQSEGATFRRLNRGPLPCCIGYSARPMYTVPPWKPQEGQGRGSDRDGGA
jgi:hypothetical protein